jgi:hypothetical protein
MDDLRLVLRNMPARERLGVASVIIAGAALVGWWIAEWAGVVVGAGLALRWTLGRRKETRESDPDGLERDLQHRREETIALFHPGGSRRAAPPAPDTRDYTDAQWLEKDLEHRRAAAERVLRPDGRPDGDVPLSNRSAEPPPLSREPVVLFPSDPRPLPPPPPPRSELFRGVPPTERPIVEEGSRWFRRPRRSGNIVE